jgi:hypothetical protein
MSTPITNITSEIEFCCFCSKNGLSFKKKDILYKNIKYKSYEILVGKNNVKLLWKNEIQKFLILVFFMKTFDRNIRNHVYYISKSHNNYFPVYENIYGAITNVNYKILKKIVKEWVQQTLINRG